MKQIVSERCREWIDFFKFFMKKCGIPEMFMCRFVGVYFLISGVVFQMRKTAGLNAVNDWKDYVREFPLWHSAMWMIFGFLVLTIVHCLVPPKWRIFDQIVLLIGTMFLACSILWRNENYHLALGLCGIAVVFVSHLIGKFSEEQFEALPEKAGIGIIAVMACAVMVFVSVTSVMHHKIFGTSCYDFGIFAQMFYSLRTNLTAVTTCERDVFLSHFNVHASFIYYLLVPLGWLIKDECVLFIVQAVTVMGGIIPLYLIAKQHNYKGFARLALCLMYIFCCELILPCYYDYHENAFLPTLLMWLLYAIDQKKMILMYIMAALTCIVKEDAPLYVICIGMYFFFDEQSRKKWHGAVMTVVSGIYFIAINHWLGEYGDGEMMASSRFGNLVLEPGDSLMSIVGNVLKNPGYFFSMFVKENTVLFLVQMFLPLVFLPFMTNKIRRFLLIIPFVIMNLVVGVSYAYAASIAYQYIFGPVCLLLYMAVLNADDLEIKKRNSFITVAACISMIMAVCCASGKLGFLKSYQDRKEFFQHMETCFDTVPEDGRVIANGWFLPHLADRPEIYLFDRNDFETDPNLAKEGEDNFEETVTGLKDIQRYDFYVMSHGDGNTAIAVPYLEEAGFVPFATTENYVIIYVSQKYLDSHDMNPFSVIEIS